MTQLKYVLLGTASLLISRLSMLPVEAVSPVGIGRSADVRWSAVVEDPFDGLIVYDRHYGDTFAYVSSWSANEIKLTHYWQERRVVGSRTVWRDRRVHRNGEWVDVPYPEDEPIYEYDNYQRTPIAILFAIHDQVYRYEDGPVSPELAQALANAPKGNMTIRLVWPNDRTTDLEIGRKTVQAWRTLFKNIRPPRPSIEEEEEMILEEELDNRFNEDGR